MKLLIFSDSHRYTAYMVEAIEAHQPDAVLHLGDVMGDARELTHIYPNLPIVSVPGNCDGWTDTPAIQLIQYQGKKILLSHGHLWHVKQGYDVALHAGRQAEADLLLFGHTHIPYCQQHGAMWVMNPGASPMNYGVVILGDSLSCSLHRV